MIILLALTHTLFYFTSLHLTSPHLTYNKDVLIIIDLEYSSHLAMMRHIQSRVFFPSLFRAITASQGTKSGHPAMLDAPQLSFSSHTALSTRQQSRHRAGRRAIMLDGPRVDALFLGRDFFSGDLEIIWGPWYAYATDVHATMVRV